MRFPDLFSSLSGRGFRKAVALSGACAVLLVGAGLVDAGLAGAGQRDVGAAAKRGVAGAAEAGLARGVVFDDANRNGRRDAGEAGVADVRVSNGREVVATDGEGRYELPLADDCILFVIKPRGWMTPMSPENLPRFYHIHKPAGSPELNHRGVEPTGALPASVDFALERRAEPDKFQVLLFGDPQVRNLQDVAFFAHDIIAGVIGTEAAFGMSLGDLAFDHLEVFEPLCRTVAHVGIPWYNVQGNHDEDYAATEDRYADDVFERVFGPAYYSFDYGPVHFLVLDDVMWMGATDGKKGDNYKGGLGPRQLEFIANDLRFVPAEQLVVLTMHIPIVKVEERERLYQLLAERPHTVSFSAHLHEFRHWFLRSAEGWPGATPHHHVALATACGSWWTGCPDEYGLPHAMMWCGAPNGWTVATFDGNQYALEYRAARRPASDQMHIHAPDAAKAGATGEVEVVVNVYAGSEKSEVEMRVDGGAWGALEREAREDPYFGALKELEKKHKLPGRKLPHTAKSSHIWVGRLPAELAPGSHLIEVRTKDMFGHGYAGRRVVRVE